MDQASSLRTLMSKTKSSSARAIGVLAASDEAYGLLCLTSIAYLYGRESGSKVFVWGEEEGVGEHLLKDIADGTFVKNSAEDNHQPYDHLASDISGMAQYRKKGEAVNSIASFVNHIEQTYSHLFYFAGRGLNSKTINFAKVADDLIVVIKPTRQSINDVLNMLHVFNNLKIDVAVTVFIDTSNQSVYEEVFSKLQDKVLKEYNYSINSIGFGKLEQGDLNLVPSEKNPLSARKKIREPFSMKVKRLLD
ncbi:hypothetical protein IMZ31_21125 (plasmid) [Pontibacillus sp. ALD_SL1]|uniref:hypothetical protein n=1 Tax=Pontibacillus sp. ALD_SL1 TaxID=2777185 RepID=UPI001A97538F|nr:hypothetical protein [Pontibacillus sp. ALD_SL1]QST03053.1 hypothetical protein IMZ31_21125 [Pontibacillus sp. ALD_SL1]